MQEKKLMIQIRWRWLAIALLLTGVMMWRLPQYHFYRHIHTGSIYKWRILMYFIPAGVLLLLSVLRPIRPKKNVSLIRGAYLVIAIVLGTCAIQRMTCEDMSFPMAFLENWLYRFLNYSIATIIFMLLWMLLRELRLAALTGYTCLGIAGYLMYCVNSFRGTPFRIADLLNIGTAVTVASGYQYPLEGAHLFWIGVGLVLGALYAWIPARKKNSVSAQMGKCACVLAAIVWTMVLLLTNVLTYLGVETDHWDETYVWYSKQKGTLALLMKDIPMLFDLKPEAYDPQELKKDFPELLTTDVSNNSSLNPNVIVIMNESLSDLQAFWQIETNQDPLPFLHSLKENVVYGNVIVSVRGGRTCDTEHSFLTGTMASPEVQLALLSTIGEETPSLAWQMKQQGYRTIGLHPFKGENYRRKSVYPLLGFDEFLDQDDFATDIPLVRDYISDQTNYEKIIELYEQKAPEERIFVFNVTMQNHGGFGIKEYEKTIEIQNADYPQLEEFLSMVRLSDKALKKLLDYFAEQQEPVIILFFGDHQPRLDMGEFGLQPELNDVQAELAQYTTPFVIWANYSLEGRYVEAVSVHYLSSLLLKTAGLPMNAYNQLLLDMADVYPIAVRKGYVDNQKHYANWNDKATWPQELIALDHLRYNRLYDPQHRLPALDILR